MTGPGQGPLAGLRVLVTRPPERAAALCAMLQELGAGVDPRPSIALGPARDTRAAAQALAALDAYDWVLFSSANGVRFFRQLAEAQGVALERYRGRIGAIGPATARALAAYWRKPEFVARQSDGPGFAAELREHVAGAERVLLVRPDAVGGPLVTALAEAGATVDAVAFYRNDPAPDAEGLVADLVGGRYGMVIFTSPSSLSRLLDAAALAARALAAALSRTTAVAIGATTAAALSAAGFPPAAVAIEPTDAGIVDAVLRARRMLASGPGPGRVVQEAGLSASAPRKTALHALHVAAGARMVEFAGWDMPVQYAGVLAEHNAVRQHAGLFDVSHMGEALVSGPQALPFLQRVTCNDVARLSPGRAHYTGLTTPEGTFVDDLLVYMLDEDRYMLVLNAANAPKDLVWLARHSAGFDVCIEDQSDAWSLLALQGPAATEILRPLVAIDPGKLHYYRFQETRIDGVDCVLSRTGYTGEHGFEIFAPPDRSPAIWQALCRLGEPLGLQLVGLAARDTLRLEAKMALYGNDIDDTTTVLEADLGWIVKLDKGDFIGRDVLARQAEDGVRRKLVGFEMCGRAIARQGYPVHVGGEEVGRVTSGSFAPFLKKNIGLAYLPIERTGTGTEIEVLIRGRAEPARVVPTPFYKRRS